MRSRAVLFWMSLALVLSGRPVYAASAEGQVRPVDLPYAPLVREMPWAPVEKAEVRRDRLDQFTRLFALMRTSERVAHFWPGRRLSSCVEPLFGRYGDHYFNPGWTERCQAAIGEVQADYYFATNPYVQAETLQRVDIRVPGTGWLQKKAIMDQLKPVLGTPVPTRPKGAPKNSPLVWRWKVGKGKAWLAEAADPHSGETYLQFSWLRPAEPAKKKAPVVLARKPNAAPAPHRLITLSELLAGVSG